MKLSVVIPVLNAAATLPACLAALEPGAGLIQEILVVDGGSTDGTVARGAKLLHAPAGRGGQMRAGAAAATGAFLLFLHADTMLSPGWPAVVEAAGAAPETAGYFRLRLASRHPAARIIEAVAGLRCRWLGLPYGDQGLLISRALLDRVGGVPDLPIMEDVALARRLRGRLKPLAATATTSPARYEGGGWLRRPLKNLVCLTLYFCGVRPARIAKLYD